MFVCNTAFYEGGHMEQALVLDTGEDVLASNFGNLGDLFPETEVKCRIRGCNNIIRLSGNQAMQNIAHGKNPHQERMCDECYAKLQTLEDKEMPCSRPGCANTWTWNRYQQLEAMVQGRYDTPPKGFCNECRESLKSVEDKQIPCRLKSCKNTWTWTAREQMAANGKVPARRLCDECFQILKTLEDKEVKCRVKGCDHTYVLNRYQQLEQIRAGKTHADAHRMCDRCFELFKSFTNKEMPCKIHGCKNTWTYSAYEQLENRLATPEGEEPKVPSRMCKDCFTFFNNAKDIEMPCRNRGCKNTWIWSRSMQLTAKVTGLDHAPSRRCAECEKYLKTLKPKEIPCQEEGCSGTWTYKPEDQLKDHCLGREIPQPRRCKSCNEFLSTHKAETLTCEKCGKSFNWSAQEQLQVQLGVFNKPTCCADCVSQEISEVKEKPIEAGAITPVIRIPTSGDWLKSPLTMDWPRSMTSALISRMEKADYRVVCIGDELTMSCEDHVEAWPTLLESRLQQRFGDSRQVCVLNAGMPGTTTDAAIARFGRDILPFSPQLVIFSFAFADSKCAPGETIGQEELKDRLGRLSASFDHFVSLLAENHIQPLAWLPNPIYPQDSDEAAYDPALKKAWEETRKQLFDSVLRSWRQWCTKANIPLVDARSLFEVNGTHSAKKWMSSWFQHNGIGASSIANWLMDALKDHLSE